MSSWGDVELVAAAAAALADGLLAAAPGSERSAAAEMATRLAGSWIEQLEYAEPAPWRTDAISAIRIEEAKAHVAVLRGQPDPVRWSRIADQWAMFEHPWEEANARMRAGDAWLAGTAGRCRSSRRAAEAELLRARATAVTLGARPLLAAIDGLLRLAGRAAEGVSAAELPQSVEGSALTRREHDVLRLLGDGRTNGQIARELYISTKTASVHVSAILRKLGVSNRVEAAAIAGRTNGGAAGEAGRLLVDWLHEVAHGPVGDLVAVGNAVDHGVAEVEADEDARLAVLGGGVGQPAERPHQR